MSQGDKDITGIEDIRKVTLVDTSELSLPCDQHSVSMEREARELLGQQMVEENKKLEELRDAVYDMMDDYTASDVRMENVVSIFSYN